jgi:hypothetical protein
LFSLPKAYIIILLSKKNLSFIRFFSVKFKGGEV